MEDWQAIVTAIAAKGAMLGAIAYPLTEGFKRLANLKQGWMVTVFALVICGFTGYCFWEWGGRQLLGVNVFAMLFGFFEATGIDRVADVLLKRKE